MWLALHANRKAGPAILLSAWKIPTILPSSWKINKTEFLDHKSATTPKDTSSRFSHANGEDDMSYAKTLCSPPYFCLLSETLDATVLYTTALFLFRVNSIRHPPNYYLHFKLVLNVKNVLVESSKLRVISVQSGKIFWTVHDNLVWFDHVLCFSILILSFGFVWINYFVWTVHNNSSSRYTCVLNKLCVRIKLVVKA